MDYLTDKFEKYQNQITFEYNTNSYKNFSKVLHNSKIFLNCIPDGCYFWYWATGLLLVLSNRSIVLSNNDPFYYKHINAWKNGYTYSNKAECLDRIVELLNLSNEQANIMMDNNLKKFQGENQIEEYCNIFFTK
jgi:hypothetical protein